MSYSVFAKYYDTLTQNIDYKKRADYFCSLITEYGNNGDILLDLACGTGKLSREFMARGFDVIATDGSYEMLSVAMSKNDEKSSIQYLCQTMQGLDLYGTIDVCICALDSVNHLTDKALLARCFSKVAMFLDPNGVFIFDANTPYKHANVLADNVFVYDYDDVYCVWQNSYDAQKRLTNIGLNFFEYDKQADVYLRSQEQFCEYAYTDEELRELITAAGLVVVAVYGDDTREPVTAATQRAVYVTKKK